MLFASSLVLDFLCFFSSYSVFGWIQQQSNCVTLRRALLFLILVDHVCVCIGFLSPFSCQISPAVGRKCRATSIVKTRRRRKEIKINSSSYRAGRTLLNNFFSWRAHLAKLRIAPGRVQCREKFSSTHINLLMKLHLRDDGPADQVIKCEKLNKGI